MNLLFANPSGAVIYALVFNSSGYIGVPETSAFLAPSDTDRPDCALPLQPTGLTGIWGATFPSFPAGIYDVSYWAQLGAEPDVDDTLVGLASRPYYWDGEGEITLLDLFTLGNTADTHTELLNDILSGVRAR